MRSARRRRNASCLTSAHSSRGRRERVARRSPICARSNSPLAAHAFRKHAPRGNKAADWGVSMRLLGSTRTRVLLVVATAAVLGLVGYALAAPSPGPQHRGTLVHRINANKDGVKVKTRRSTDLIAQDVVYHPGDNSGWHYHLGIVLIEVDGPAGNSLVFHDQCRT